MTVYRRNPLLMTVMGANPGRSARRREDPVDAAIGAAWHRLMSGIQVPIMDIPRIFRDVKLEMAGGMPLEEAVMRVGARFQVNRNPSRDPLDFQHRPPYGVAILGQGSGAPQVVGRKYKTLRAAALVARTLRRRGRWATVFDVASGDPVSDSEWDFGVRRNPSLAASLAGGLAGAFVTHAMSNPGPSFVVIETATGKVVYTKRATGMGNAAIDSCFVKANHLSQKTGRAYIVFLDIRGLRVGMQVNVPMVRALGITGEVLPRPNPLTSPEMAEMRDRERFYVGRSQKYEQAGNWPDAAHFRGAAQESRHIRERYHAKGTKFEPNPGPRGKRKITMTIEQFAKWVKAKRDPAMWKAFLAKFRGYEKWTHGSKSRKVTVEWQNVPGMDGLWITYDGGKQPESTYIMPKGSKRKGAWKHPWDTMPDIKHDAEAGLVLTKLRGRSKITNFYHR